MYGIEKMKNRGQRIGFALLVITGTFGYGLPERAYGQSTTTTTEVLAVYSASWKTLQAQEQFISSSLSAANASYRFAGYARTGDTAPTATLNNCYVVLETGTTFGQSVQAGQVLVGNGTGFDAKTLSAFSGKQFTDPANFTGSGSTTGTYQTDAQGVTTLSNGNSAFNYSVAGTSGTDTLTVINTGLTNYDVSGSRTTSLLSATYDAGETGSPSLLVLNQQQGNNLKITRKTVVETTVEGTDFGMEGTYFVSSSEGSDTNDGLSYSRPKKTIAAVTALKPAAGSKIALKANDVFRELVKTTSAGEAGKYITFGAYGVGEKPVVSGCDLVTGWENYSGNIYRAKVAVKPVLVFVDGTFVPVARMPKKGFYTITSTSSSTNIYSSELGSATDYSGATALIKNTLFTLKNCSVVASAGQTLTTDNTTSIAAGWGFLLMNKLNLLTQANEWVYDASTQYLYLWVEGNKNPGSVTVEAAARDYCIHTDKAYIRIENIETFGSNKYNIYAQNGTSPVLANCDIENGAIAGIWNNGEASGSTIEGCRISKVGGNGIQIWSPNSTIADNNIEFCGTNAYWNPVTDGYLGRGISFTGSATLGACEIIRNRITNVGYIGINFRGPNVKVKNNFVDNALLDFADGGGIYTWQGAATSITSAGSEISGNLISNCWGNNSYTPVKYLISCAVYCDSYTTSVKIENNVMYSSSQGVLINNDASSCTVSNNLIVDCGTALCASHSGSGNSFVDNKIVIFNKNTSTMPWWQNQPQVFFVFESADPAGNNSNRNVYVTQYQQSALFKFNLASGGYRIGYDAWRSASTLDSESVYKAGVLTGQETLFVNDSHTESKTETLDGTFVDINGSAVNALVLSPFSAVVLWRTGN